MSIKAIETVYKGYKFRSRLEARWAVFFDTLGIEYQYEPEGFDLDGVRYLPDFWIPLLEYWVEIKPVEPNHTEKDKASRLSELTQKPVVIIYGDFASSTDVLNASVFPENKIKADDNSFYAFMTRLVLAKAHSGLMGLLSREQWPVFSAIDEVSIFDKLAEGFQAGRQARF